MRTEIKKLHNQLATTMIYVTHDQIEAMTMGDRIAVMKDGKIQQMDTPLNTYNRPVNLFVAGFIGSPAMNFIHGRLTRNNDTLCFFDDSVNFPIPDYLVKNISDKITRDIILGIRPEDIEISSSDEWPELKVEVSEPMGNEIYLFLSTGKHKIIARVGADHLYSPNSLVRISFHWEKAHFFDPVSEKVVSLN
jgi:multiple sugar transport system ATP-binding protein